MTTTLEEAQHAVDEITLCGATDALDAFYESMSHVLRVVTDVPSHQWAVETLIKLASAGGDIREVYIAVQERLGGVGCVLKVGVLIEVLSHIMPGLAGGRGGDGFCRAVARDLPAVLLNSFTQKNAFLAMMEVDTAAMPEEPADPTDHEVTVTMDTVYPSLCRLNEIVATSRCSREVKTAFSTSLIHAWCASRGVDEPLPTPCSDVLTPLKESCTLREWHYLVLYYKREEDAVNFYGEEDVREKFDFWDQTGLGITLGAANVATNTVFEPKYVLEQKLRYYSKLLDSTSAYIVRLGVGYVQEAVAEVEPYSLRYCEEDKIEVGEEVMGGEGFEKVFGFMQKIAGVMTQCPVQYLRAQSAKTLGEVVKRLDEYSRFKMYTAFIRKCPYPSVTSLTITQVKNEVVAEYNALVESPELLSTSAFLQPGSVSFYTSIVDEFAKTLPHTTDPLASTLSLLLFIVLREATSPLLSLPPPAYKSLRTAVSTVSAKVDTLQPTATIQTAMLLSFSVERLDEALKEMGY